MTQAGERQTEATFEEVLARVKAIIAEVLGVDPAEIGDDDDLAENWDVDSLDVVKIALALVEEWGLADPEGIFDASATPNDVARVLSTELESC